MNWFRTVRLPWREVERFGFDDGDGVWVRCRDGHEHPVSAFQHPASAPEFARTPGRRAAARLEAVRRKRRGRGGGRDR